MSGALGLLIAVASGFLWHDKITPMFAWGIGAMWGIGSTMGARAVE